MEIDEEEVSREVLAEVDLVERLMDRAEDEGEIQTTIHMSIGTEHQTEVYLKQYLLKVKPYSHRFCQKKEYDQLTHTQKGELLKTRKGSHPSKYSNDNKMDMRSIKSTITDTIMDVLNSESTHLYYTNDNESQSVAAHLKRRRTSQN